MLRTKNLKFQHDWRLFNWQPNRHRNQKPSSSYTLGSKHRPRSISMKQPHVRSSISSSGTPDGRRIQKRSVTPRDRDRPRDATSLSLNGPRRAVLPTMPCLLACGRGRSQAQNVSAAIDQAERYSVGLIGQSDFSFAGGPWREHKVPFVFAANGRSYLKQIETESGIWFRDTRRAANHRRALADWLTPEGLLGLIEIDQDAATDALKALPFDFGFPLRDYQQNAIEAVEKALEAERRTMLLAMATGTGKTKLAIAMLYRLLATKRFRRICFVVDRSALGIQAAGEFTN